MVCVHVCMHMRVATCADLNCPPLSGLQHRWGGGPAGGAGSVSGWKLTLRLPPSLGPKVLTPPAKARGTAAGFHLTPPDWFLSLLLMDSWRRGEPHEADRYNSLDTACPPLRFRSLFSSYPPPPPQKKLPFTFPFESNFVNSILWRWLEFSLFFVHLPFHSDPEEWNLQSDKSVCVCVYMWVCVWMVLVWSLGLLFGPCCFYLHAFICGWIL